MSNRKEVHYKISHNGFENVPAGSLVVVGQGRAADMVERLMLSGATGIKSVPLTEAEYAAERAARLPK